MKAICKKLLSLLVVMAMIVSMVPFGALSVFAAETDAPSNAVTVTPGQANLPEGVQDIIDEAAKVDNSDAAIDAHIEAGTCPMCGATGIEWKKWDANNANKGNTSDQVWHFYLDEAVTKSGNVFGIYKSGDGTSANNTYCAAIKSTAVISNTGTRFVMLSGTNNVINIMGTGKAITNVGTTQDYGMFQIGGGTLNLYGGTYILEDAAGGTDANGKSTDGVYAAIRAVGGDVNIFNDAIIGPETVDTTVTTYNVSISNANSEVKMYGGTIRNGVTAKNGFSGNVTIANSGKFYMYGGTIENGQYNTSVNPASVGGNIVVGGVPEGQTASTPGSFYMYGGTVTGGKAYNGGNGGGNINAYNSENKGVMELMGGIIKDGWAKAAGGNVQIQGGTNHKIGGTVLITNGSAVSGGNVQVAASRKLTMEGGFIQGGALATSDKNATNGGGVYVAGTFDMTGGEIDGCTVSNNGGSIYAAGGATVNVGANATIKNGLSKAAGNGGGGGNVYLAASTSVGATMTTEGTIIGGTVDGGSSMQSSGGNISVVANGGIQSVLTVNGGTIANGSLAYGTAGSSFGGNIRAYNCKVVINDGLIYGGTTGTAKANSNIGVQGGTSSTADTNCTLEVNGGVIVGDMLAGTYNTPSGTKTGDYTYTCDLKISGDAKIVNNYKLDDGSTVWAQYGGLSYYAATPYDFSGLTEGAQIVMTGSKGGVFSTAMETAAAKAIEGCFSCSNSALTVEANDEGKLTIIEIPVKEPTEDVFDPWNCGGMAYCPVCKEVKEWTEYKGENNAANPRTEMKDDGTQNYSAHFHLYLAENMTYDTQFFVTYRKACFNLNGHNITAGETGTYAFNVTGTLNLIDTEGGAVVAGNGTSGNGAALNVNGGKASATYNLYGGTYTKLAGNTASAIVMIGGNGGTINMYEGAVIDATGLTTNTISTAVYMHGSAGGTNSGKAVFNMYGGKILGGTSTGNGGTIRIGSAASESATTTYAGVAEFNLYDGEISGGIAQGGSGGGNIYICGNTLNIYGGTIKGGQAVGTTTTNADGSTKLNGGNGGNIFADKKTKADSAKTIVPGVVNMEDGTIEGGYAATNGAELVLNTDSALNMTGGEIKGGTADNQGGVLRAYKAEVNMSGDAKIYAGTAQGSSKTHGIWLVCADMTMTDNAIVYGKGTDAANAIMIAPYGEAGKNNTVISTLTLSGNATVKNETGESRNSIAAGWTLNSNADAADDACGKLIITNDWTGEAYVTLTKNAGVAEGATSSSLVGYNRGETIDNAIAVCGTIADGEFTKGGSFKGSLYYGPQTNTPVFGAEGDLIIAMAAVVTADAENWYLTNQAAVDAYKGEGYVLIGNDAELTIDGEIYIDSRGYTVTVNGTGTLYAIDRANDDYNGYGAWNIGEGVTIANETIHPVNGNRYIILKNESGTYGAHRIEMGIKSVTLRTNAAGLYYNAYYTCDSAVAKAITAYGVAVSVEDVPGADFQDVLTDRESVYTDFAAQYEALEDSNTVAANSTSVFGIMKDSNSAADNAEHGKMDIYANAYIEIKGEKIYMADTENVGKQAGVAYSLYDVMAMVDDADFWSTLSVADQIRVNEFYTEWNAQGGMADWTFENIALVQNG